MITGNKGEWSEIYAFLKILADGELYPGDANLNKIQNFFYPVLSVIRREFTDDMRFAINEDNIDVFIGDTFVSRITTDEFANEASYLLNSIKTAKGAFSVAPTIDFLTKLNINTLKASSVTKADIVIKIHDSRTNLQPVLGFSIKSKLGSSSTLLNASSATNFVFDVKGSRFSIAEMNYINGIDSSRKIRDRVQTIYNKGRSLEFYGTDNRVFYNNLVLIDSLLPQIVATMLKAYYKDQIVYMTDLCQYIKKINPLKFDQSLNHKFYEHKLKRFLSETALGMMPNTIWGGEYDGTEGYIVIKEDGEVVCYHIINRNLFEDYLLANTKLDTPSSTRHGYGIVFEEHGNQYFKLNFQIRFT